MLARLASRLAYATFDPELAALSGVRVALLEYVLMALVAVVVVAGLRSVGVVLVSALVVLPAATAHLLGARLVTIASLSVGLAVGATLAGLLLSYHWNLAAGATIVVLLGAAFFARPRRLRRPCGSRRRPAGADGARDAAGAQCAGYSPRAFMAFVTSRIRAR